MRLALVALVAAAALLTLARRFRAEPLGPAPTDDIDWLLEWVIEPRQRPVYATASEWRN